MKKTLLMVAFVTSIIQAQATTVITNVSAGKKSKDCTGLGVCATKTTVENSIRATWEWSDENPGSLTLRIADDAVASAPEDFLAALESGRFNQSETLPVDESLCNELGTDGSLTIMSGTYAVAHKDGIYSIVFTVRQE